MVEQARCQIRSKLSHIESGALFEGVQFHRICTGLWELGADDRVGIYDLVPSSMVCNPTT